MYETIEMEIKEGEIGLITLNRPEKLNAINLKMVEELVDALSKLESNDNVKVVVITGKGRAFSAGADVREMANSSHLDAMKRGHSPLWDKMKKFRKPIIAALNGITAGGGLELAMACDIIIASESAMLGQPEINIGIIPGAGGTQRLTRVIGKYKAMELVLTGKLISAQEAERLGLVNKVVKGEELISEAILIAREISSKAPIAVELAKSAILKAYDSFLEQGLDFERRNFVIALTTEDAREGMRAFLEKRSPIFRGK
jgi:enoyl-CoA hydratase/carnithine racemase